MNTKITKINNKLAFNISFYKLLYINNIDPIFSAFRK